MLDTVNASMNHITAAGIKEETTKIVDTEAAMADLVEDTRVVKMIEVSLSSVSRVALE